MLLSCFAASIVTSIRGFILYDATVATKQVRMTPCPRYRDVAQVLSPNVGSAMHCRTRLSYQAKVAAEVSAEPHAGTWR